MIKKHLLLKIIILTASLILFYCSFSSYNKYIITEGFTIFSEQQNHSNYFNFYINKINEILEEQRELKNSQMKILDKLDYVTDYKKINKPNIDNKLNQYNSIQIVNNIYIKDELTNLGLQNLYQDEIVGLEEGPITTDELNKYKNVLKTKLLIDNEIITVNINDEVYEKSNFSPDTPKYPDDTNNLYYTEKIIPLINESFETTPNEIQFQLKLDEIKLSTNNQPEIYIKNNDNEIDMNPNNQIYLNDTFKQTFITKIEEFNIENENLNQLKESTKNSFENGDYLGSDYIVSRSEYINEFH